MRDRLTLTIDPDLIEKIKLEAVREKRSVSKIAEEYFKQHLGILPATPAKKGRADKGKKQRQ